MDPVAAGAAKWTHIVQLDIKISVFFRVLQVVIDSIAAGAAKLTRVVEITETSGASRYSTRGWKHSR